MKYIKSLHKRVLIMLSLIILVFGCQKKASDVKKPIKNKVEDVNLTKNKIAKEIIKPIISRKGKLLFEDSFSESEPRSEWRVLHGTRWKIEDGVYRGIPSTKEFQDSHTSHKGTTPSMLLNVKARDVILEMSVKISGELNSAHLGYNEGPTQTTSGHVFRLILDVEKGTFLQKDRHSQIKGDEHVILDQSDWKPNRDEWITVLIETQGEEVVAQVVDGPTLKMKSPRLNVTKRSGNLKARGGEGAIAYDNVRIWEALPLDKG